MTRVKNEGTHEYSFSQQNVDQQNSKQKRLCCQALRVCDWVTDFSLISDTNAMHLA
jgi:hypothetical protein